MRNHSAWASYPDFCEFLGEGPLRTETARSGSIANAAHIGARCLICNRLFPGGPGHPRRPRMTVLPMRPRTVNFFLPQLWRKSGARDDTACRLHNDVGDCRRISNHMHVFATAREGCMSAGACAACCIAPTERRAMRVYCESTTRRNSRERLQGSSGLLNGDRNHGSRPQRRCPARFCRDPSSSQPRGPASGASSTPPCMPRASAQAEREIALYLHSIGGKFTDDAEREIERRFLGPSRC